MKKLRGLFILDDDALQLIYSHDARRDIARHVDLVAPPQTRESIRRSGELLKQTEIIFSGWGMPRADKAFLDAAPQLQAIFYAAGATGVWMTPDVWERNVIVTTASAANAIPVAEYTLATILFSLKHGWSLAHETRRHRTFPDRNRAPGCFGSCVGLISLGITARTLIKLLRPFDLKICAYDPYVSESEAAQLGVELTSLDALFRDCDVVSLHAPLLPETTGMINGILLASMKPGATFINTARGTIVQQSELIDVARKRTDLQFILDVCEPEPPAADSPLYELPNIVLTPHIAGSVGRECHRMGQMMVDELRRFVTGQPLEWRITPDAAANSSHWPAGAKVSVALGPGVTQRSPHAIRAGAQALSD